MAEKQNIEKPIANKSYKGLFLDANLLEQPEGTYRFALNAVNQTADGNMHMLTTEQSNKIYKEIGLGGATVIGSIYIDDNEHILFITDKNGTYSGIYKMTGYEELTQIMLESDLVGPGISNTSHLTFSINHQITGEYRLRNGCEKTIYWTDNFNTIKTMNLAEAERGEYIDGSGNIIGDKLQLIKLSETVPTFGTMTVEQGGELKSGTYNFAIQYVDENYNQTHWMTTSMTIPIYASSLVGSYDGVTGSSNIQYTTEPSTVEEAAFGASPTGKRIKVEIENLDTDYAYYRVAVIEATSGTGLVNRVLMSDYIPTDDTIFIADGNEQNYTEIAVEEILPEKLIINTAEALTQVENRLLLANVTGVSRPYCSYQATASEITVKYRVYDVTAYDYNEYGDAKNPNTYYQYMSYMGGEVYAFGIVYIFDDGSESPVCHISGRPSGTAAQTGNSYDDRELLRSGINGAKFADIQPFTSLTESAYNALAVDSTQRIERWRVYDTANSPDGNDEGLMAFWEASAYDYDDRDNCDETADTFWGSDGYSWSQANLTDSKIRHHKFPNRNTVPHVSTTGTNEVSTAFTVVIDFDTAPTDPIVAEFKIDYESDADPGNTYTLHAQIPLGPASQLQYSWRQMVEGTVAVADYTLYTESGMTNPLINTSSGSNDGISSRYTVETSYTGNQGDDYENVSIDSSYPSSNGSTDVPLNGTNFRIAQTFTSTGGTLAHAMFNLKRVGTPTGTFQFELYETSGGNPTGSAVAQSETYTAANLPVSYQDISLEFTDGYALTNTVVYAIAINYTSGDSSNYIHVHTDTSAPSHPGTGYLYTTSWSSQAWDACHYVSYEGGSCYSQLVRASVVYPAPGTETLKILGIKFSNISLPTGAVDYKIVRAKRDISNRTILGKALSGLTRYNESYLTFNNLVDGGKTSGDGVEWNFRNRYIYSPEMLFRKYNIEGSYLKWENYFSFESSEAWGTGVEQDVGGADGGIFDNDGYDWEGVGRTVRMTVEDVSSIPEENHRIENTTHLTAAGKKDNVNITTEGETAAIRTVYNVAVDHPISIAKLSLRSDVTPPYQYPTDDGVKDNEIAYVSLCIERDVYSNLESLKYYQCHNNTGEASTTFSIFGGDTYISHFYGNSTNIPQSETVKRIWDFILKVVIAIVVTAAAVIASIFSLGAAATPAIIAVIIVIGALGLSAEVIVLAFNTFANDMSESPGLVRIVEDTIINRDKYKDDTFINTMLHMYGTWIESDINVALREPTNVNNGGFQTAHGVASSQSYLRSKCINYHSTEGKSYLPVPYSEVFRVNEDFMRQSEQKVYFALTSTYDCCSECQESFPERVYFSEKSFLEEVFDSYTNILPLNYISVPGESGEITNIFSISNALYAHTKSNLWYIPKNTQERLTGDIISLVSSGNFFDTAPRRVFNDKVGAAGSTQKLATLQTKHGTFFIDSREGIPYMLNFSSQTGTQIEDLCRENGMKKWFRENGRFVLYDQVYELFGEKIPIANPSNLDNGIGFIAAYDYENDRILLTKRDYRIGEGGNNNRGLELQTYSVIDDDTVFDGEPAPPTEGIENTLAYNRNDGKFYTFENDITSEEPFNSDIFENKSFTISYSFATKTWISFHSYLPSFYIYDYKNLYSLDGQVTFDDFNINAKNNIWRHNEPYSFRSFYDNVKPFIIDFIIVESPLESGIFEEILFTTEAEKAATWSVENYGFGEQRYTTFNYAVIYNARQSTGLVELIALDGEPDANFMSRSITNTTGQVTLRKENRNWKMNDFRDLRVDYEMPLFHTAWSEVGDSYFIDKVPNQMSISVTKDWTEQEPFKDKFLGIRLIFDNDDTTIRLRTQYNIGIKKRLDP